MACQFIGYFSLMFIRCYTVVVYGIFKSGFELAPVLELVQIAICRY